MIDRLFERLIHGNEYEINFNNAVKIKLSYSENSIDFTILHQDVPLNFDYVTPYGYLKTRNRPELQIDTVFLIGKNNVDTCYIPRYNLEYLENAILILYCYGYKIIKSRQEILNEVISPLLSIKVKCPLCNKEHNGFSVYCDECLSKFKRCKKCNRPIIDDNYIEKNGEIVCFTCLSKENNHLWKDYCSKPKPIFIQSENETEKDHKNRFYGFELEVERDSCKFYNSESSNILSSQIEHIYFKNDGSLDDGFEIIHQPSTIKYYYENIRQLLELVEKLGYTNADSAGLHIHIGKNVFGDTLDERLVNIGKLLYFANKYYNNLVILSQRNPNVLDYCLNIDLKPNKFYLLGDNQLNSSNINQIYKEYVYDFIKYSNRYRVINLFFTPTVEFRLPSSTLDFDIFISQFQLFDRIIDLCCSKDIDIKKVDFFSLCGKYEELDKLIEKNKKSLDK